MFICKSPLLIPWVHSLHGYLKPYSLIPSPGMGKAITHNRVTLFQLVRMSLVQCKCSVITAGVKHISSDVEPLKQWDWYSNHESQPPFCPLVEVCPAMSLHSPFKSTVQKETETVIHANKQSNPIWLHQIQNLPKSLASSSLLLITIPTCGLLSEATRNLWLS